MADFKPLPPKGALAYLRARGLHLDPSFGWLDYWHEDHASGFTVAKSAGFDILQDIHDALTDALSDGTTFETFKRRLVPILQAKGWWGRAFVTDPATGENVVAQLGSTRRLRTIFDVNLRASQAAGSYIEAERLKKYRPYLRYVAIMDGCTRPEHRLFNGTILPFDHPWWQTHYPPNGWNCRCRVLSVDDADLKRYGWSVSKAPPDVGPPRQYLNKRTGEISMVPAGIDPGFAYNAGQASLDLHAARLASLSLIGAPPALSAAEAQATLSVMAPLIDRDLAQWVAAIDRGQAVTGALRVIGALSQDSLDALASLGRRATSAAVLVTDRAVAAALVDGADLASLQRLAASLRGADQIVLDTEDGSLLYVSGDSAISVTPGAAPGATGAALAGPKIPIDRQKLVPPRWRVVG